MKAVLHQFALCAVDDPPERGSTDFLTTLEAGTFRFVPTYQENIACLEPCEPSELAEEIAHLDMMEKEVPELANQLYQDLRLLIPELKRGLSTVDTTDWRPAK